MNTLRFKLLTIKILSVSLLITLSLSQKVFSQETEIQLDNLIIVDANTLNISLNGALFELAEQMGVLPPAGQLVRGGQLGTKPEGLADGIVKQAGVGGVFTDRNANCSTEVKLFDVLNDPASLSKLVVDL